MEKQNFNNEKIKNKDGEVKNSINGIRNINAPKREYLQKNRFKEINLNKKKGGFLKKLFITGILLVIVAGVVSYYFHSATFEVKNKVKSIKFNNDIKKANNFNPKVGEEVPFKLMKFNVSIKKDLKSELVEEVSEKAIGKIKIINNTTKNQKLRKETRFETDGKIFKTYKSVIIPAKKFVIVDAFADIAGSEFNLKKGSKMVIPGFKESKSMRLYKDVTGEIYEDFKGGFIGKRDIPDKKDFESKKELIEKELRERIDLDVRKKTPTGFILNTDGIFTKIKFETKKDFEGLAIVGVADVKAIIFEQKDFLSLVTGLKKDDIVNFDISKTNKGFLKFKILNKDKINIENLKNFVFELNGNLKYTKKFDKDIFLNSVKGKNLKEFNLLKNNKFKDFDINLNISPFWLTTIPNNIDDISIKEIND